jgi:hypothetical protein
MLKLKDLQLFALAGAALIFVATGAAQATTTLSGAFSADNGFEAFLSTDDAVLGAIYLGGGSNWQQATSFSTGLTQGQTYYLQIVADNQSGPGSLAAGNPDALLGSFNLSGSGFYFANEKQNFSTAVSGWSASPNLDASIGVNGEQLYASSGNWMFTPNSSPIWTVPNETPITLGVNGGTDIWTSVNGGPIGPISSSAQWIWSATDPTGEAFFSTRISSAVPELSTWEMSLVGFAALGFAGFRRSKSRTVLLAAA